MPFLAVLFHSLCLLVCDVDTERRGATGAPPRLPKAYVNGTGGAARGTRVPLRPAALNVSVFSLPESYEGWLKYLPPLCALALAASIHRQDLSANGESAVEARDKLAVGEAESESANCPSVWFPLFCQEQVGFD